LHNRSVGVAVLLRSPNEDDADDGERHGNDDDDEDDLDCELHVTKSSERAPNNRSPGPVQTSMEPVFATVAEEDGVSVTLGGGERIHTLGAAVPTELRTSAVRARAPVSRGRARGRASSNPSPAGARPGLRLSGRHPAGATHRARFGSDGARILIVRAAQRLRSGRGCFDRIAELRGRELTWLAWRLAGELRAEDTAAPLAAEGFALELLAATTRETRAQRTHARPPAWLRSAEELLRARLADRIGLAELAETVGVHPAYLARAFRAHYGLSVGEYGRRLRLAWAAAELARGEAPLAELAANAGFADQSHFHARLQTARRHHARPLPRTGPVSRVPRPVAHVQDTGAA